MIFIIWRESVFKNNFKCNICGNKLIDENGNPCGTISNCDFLQCRKCKNVVANIEKEVKKDD